MSGNIISNLGNKKPAVEEIPAISEPAPEFNNPGFFIPPSEPKKELPPEVPSVEIPPMKVIVPEPVRADKKSLLRRVFESLGK